MHSGSHPTTIRQELDLVSFHLRKPEYTQKGRHTPFLQGWGMRGGIDATPGPRPPPPRFRVSQEARSPARGSWSSDPKTTKRCPILTASSLTLPFGPPDTPTEAETPSTPRTPESHALRVPSACRTGWALPVSLQVYTCLHTSVLLVTWKPFGQRSSLNSSFSFPRSGPSVLLNVQLLPPCPGRVGALGAETAQ